MMNYNTADENPEKGERERDESLESTRINIEKCRTKEDENDAEHSRKNAQNLNERYSFLFNLFFGSQRRFVVWAIVYFVLCFFYDKDSNDMYFIFIKKVFYALNFIFLFLLTFPTAKGIRRLFREIIQRISKKYI